MTQIAGLGMSGTASVNNAKSSAAEPSKEAYEQFASIMSQNTQGYFNLKAGAGAYEGWNRKTQEIKPSDSMPFRSSDRRISQVDRTDIWTDAPSMMKKVQELGNDVKDVVRETLDVTEEELTQAMELLGLSEMNLLQPQNLMQLAGQLTGSEDVSALLTSNGVQELMQNVTELFSDFRQQNGIGDLEFADLLTQLSMNIDELEAQVKAQLGIMDDAQSPVQTDVWTGQMTEEEVSQTQQTEEQTGMFSSILQSQGERSGQMQETVSQDIQSQDADVSPLQNVPQTEEALAQTNEHMSESMSDSKSGAQTDHSFEEQTDLAGKIQHVQMQDQTMQNTGSVPQTADIPQSEPMIRYESLMNQMEGLARAFATSEGTTLQLQLNPESLGRLVLTVSEKHGNVTAQITATNEQVKEALQTQMAELHATLQAQGVKVEAVEVTVATHEFEQNLDGNASADAQLQQNASQQEHGQHSSRRNLDQSMIESIGGSMTEEENLAAQMMRDNGGSVDYTA